MSVAHPVRMANTAGNPRLPPRHDVEGERRIRRSIEAAAAQNVDLLKEITTTQEAVYAFQSNEARLSKLDDELTSQLKLLEEAEFATQNRLATYTKEKDSFGRRWKYILSRKRQQLEQNIKDAEKAYLEALAAQNQTEQRRNQLLSDQKVIKDENEELQKKTKRHEKAHHDIDELYDQIFDGPTPGFPDEDEVEQTFKARLSEHNLVVATLKATVGATKEIGMVKTAIVKSQREAVRAQYEMDTSFFGGVDNALIYLDRISRLLEQALTANQKSHDGLPRPLERDYIAAHKLLSQHLTAAHSVALKSLRSTYVTVDGVYGAVLQLEEALKRAAEAEPDVTRQLKANDRTARQSIKLSARTLEDARQALQEIRQNAFEVTVGHGAAAPAYSECCDRAETVEGHTHAECERMLDPVLDESAMPPPPSYEAIIGDAPPAGSNPPPVELP